MFIGPMANHVAFRTITGHLVIMAKRFAFADESDWYEGPVCVIGGYVASDPVWQDFETQWTRILKNKGLENEGFHSKDFFNRRAPYAQKADSKNPYKDWSEPEAADFIGSLTTEINRHKIVPIGGVPKLRRSRR